MRFTFLEFQIQNSILYKPITNPTYIPIYRYITQFPICHPFPDKPYRDLSPDPCTE